MTQWFLQKCEHLPLRKKGQVGLEAIIAVAFSLAILLIVLLHTGQQKLDIKAIDNLDKEKNECNKISAFISLMNASESSDTIFIESELGATITNNVVLAGNHYCTFIGQVADTILVSGKIKIYESNGAVKLENV